MIQARKRWLQAANDLITDLKQRRVHISKVFQGKEHLRPLRSLSKHWRDKVGSFLAKDPAQLVSLRKVAVCVEGGLKLGEEQDSYQMRTLKDTLQQGLALQSQLCSILADSCLSYNEARFFQGELFAVGVRFPEIEIVRDSISVNGGLERQLVSQLDKTALLKLQGYLTHPRLDQSLSAMVITLCEEYDQLEAQLDLVLSKQHLDFKDLTDLEEVDSNLKKSQLAMPRAEQFADLFSSFSWTIKASLECGVKASTLSHATVQLKRVFERRLLDSPAALVLMLEHIANVNFSITPIAEFVDWSKVLLWRARIKKAFSEDDIDLACIEELVAVAPRNVEHYEEAYNDFGLVEGVLTKAKGWRKNCADFTSQLDALFKESVPSEMMRRVVNLVSSLNYLRATYLKEDLKLIKNLVFHFEQLRSSEKTLVACRHIATVLNGSPIHINEFLTTIEIIEKQFKDDRKYSMLMHQFQKIQKDIIPSLDELNKVSNAVSQESITPKGSKVSDIQAKQKLKVKVFDLDFHLEKLNARFDLGDLGKRVQNHLNAFFKWKEAAISLMDQNTIKSLLTFTTVEQLALLLKRSRELRRSIQSSNLYTEVLEDLIAYNWSLKVVEFLKLKPLKVGEIKLLIDQHCVPKKHTKRLLKLLQDQIVNAKMITRFCEKAHKRRPTEKEVEALKTILKSFRISMPGKVAMVKEFISKIDKIKQKINKFLSEAKPSLKKVEAMADSLTNEPILFEKSISKMRDSARRCRQLVVNAKKDPSHPSLLKIYKELQISCKEFENLVRDKKLDQGIKKEYEGLITGKFNDFSKIEEFELVLDTINDLDWVEKSRKVLTRRKINLLREAVENRTVFYLDIHQLKTLGRDAFLIEDKSNMVEDLKFIEELIKKAESRLRSMKTLSYQKLKTIKKRIFGCLDVSKEISDLKMKFKESEKRRNMMEYSQEEGKLARNLVKRVPQHSSKEVQQEIPLKKGVSGGTKASRIHQKKLHNLKVATREGILNKKSLTKKEESKEKALKAMKASKKLGKLSLTNNGDAQSRIAIPEFDKGISALTSGLLNPRAGIADMEVEDVPTEPKNSEGIWSIFEGTLRLESDSQHKTFEGVQFATMDKWVRISQFPKLPMVPSIRDTISHQKLSELLEKGSSSLGSQVETLKVMGGVVTCQGLSRVFMRSELEKEAEQVHFSINYTNTSKIVLVSSKKFEKKWFGLFSDPKKAKEVDCDFYFFLISEERVAQHRLFASVAKGLAKKNSGESITDLCAQIMQDRSTNKSKEEAVVVKSKRVRISNLPSIAGIKSMGGNKENGGLPPTPHMQAAAQMGEQRKGVFPGDWSKQERGGNLCTLIEQSNRVEWSVPLSV